jgi:hypothetical protein
MRWMSTWMCEKARAYIFPVWLYRIVTIVRLVPLSIKSLSSVYCAIPIETNRHAPLLNIPADFDHAVKSARSASGDISMLSMEEMKETILRSLAIEMRKVNYVNKIWDLSRDRIELFSEPADQNRFVDAISALRDEGFLAIVALGSNVVRVTPLGMERGKQLLNQSRRP